MNFDNESRITTFVYTLAEEMAARAFAIRSACTTTDAPKIRALIGELADYQNMSSGPKITSELLKMDLDNGYANALVAFEGSSANDAAETEMAAYLIYYLPSSTTVGSVLFIEDIYIRPQFRRRGLGIEMMRQITRQARILQRSTIEWNVLRSNKEAIAFYDALVGTHNLTSTITEQVNHEHILCWRLERSDFDKAIGMGGEALEGLKELEIVAIPHENLTGSAGINKRIADWLTKTWLGLTGQKKANAEFGPRPSQQISGEELNRLFCTNAFGVVLALKRQVNAPKDHKLEQLDSNVSPEDTVYGMAVYHESAYSTWLGRYLTVDRVCVERSHRRKGIATALVGELVKMSKNANYQRIGWSANESQTPLFRKFNAINLTERDGWLLYRWNYAKWTDN